MAMYDIPEIGMVVTKLTRKGKIVTGEIIATGNDGCGIYSWFAVDWNVGGTYGDTVEYNLTAWGDTVWVPTCPECDSPYHTNHPGY